MDKSDTLARMSLTIKNACFLAEFQRFVARSCLIASVSGSNTSVACRISFMEKFTIPRNRRRYNKKANLVEQSCSLVISKIAVTNELTRYI